MDCVRPLLENLRARDDLASSSLDLSLSFQVVPETRFGKGCIGVEDSHSEQGWVGVALGWELPAHDKELSDLSRVVRHEHSRILPCLGGFDLRRL